MWPTQFAPKLMNMESKKANLFSDEGDREQDEVRLQIIDKNDKVEFLNT